MLNKVDNFLTIGALFPPNDERARLNNYRNQKLLFDGKHSHVFYRWSQIDGVENLNVVVNWHRRLSTLWADMLFGQAPEIKGDNQEVVDALVERNDLVNVLYEAAIDVSRHGTGILKVRLTNDGAVVETVPPDIWFPVVSPSNLKEVTHHVLAWTWEETVGAGVEQRKVKFLRVEIHEKGKITYRTYEMTSDLTISRQIEEEEEYTNVNSFLVHPINNLTTSDSFIGIADYDDINPILEEIEIRLTQISRILDKHADPSMYGDDSALEYDEKTGEYVVRGGGKFYPVSEGNVVPNYITWNGQLEDAFKQIDSLMEQFYVVTNTSPAAFGQLKQGLAESGSALKRLMMATLIKSNRMKLKFEQIVVNVITTASELEGRAGGNSVGKVWVEWRDSLPADITEDVVNEVSRYNAGLTSLEASLGRLDGLTGEALTKEIALIEGNKKKSPVVDNDKSPEANNDAGNQDI